ncbi:MAG: lipoyl(octanoyl) transferase LipB [Sphingobacteriales bacterium]|nr:lipoyl(octanoyl) transferase LipB [Sphingobacteriales bacterium]
MNAIINKNIQFQDWGLTDYETAWQRQEQLLQEIVAIKTANRLLPPHQQAPTPNYLIFCNHPHVYTLGKSGKMEHLLYGSTELEQRGITFVKSNRGGDITYHGPGQVVGYPILDLENFFTDIHRYMRLLEETIIRTLADYGVQGGRSAKETGVWLDTNTPRARKICAMGVRCSRWITMHGWAFNINTDLAYFGGIVPCGIADKSVASLHHELGSTALQTEPIKQQLKTHFADLFEAQLL